MVVGSSFVFRGLGGGDEGMHSAGNMWFGLKLMGFLFVL